MSKLTDLSNEIADELEHRAAAELARKASEANVYYDAYVKACEDFAKRLRQSNMEVIQDGIQKS